MTTDHLIPTKDTPLSRRDRDFMAACKRVIARSASRSLTVAQVASLAALEPAPEYYTTYGYALKRLRSLRAGHPHRDPGPRWTELLQRTEELCRRRGIRFHVALAHVLAGGASSFFMCPSTARRVYHRVRRNMRRRPS